MNKYRELRKTTGLSMQKFGDRYGIPLRTIQGWEGGERVAPSYVYELLKFKVEHDNAEFKKGLEGDLDDN